jgi:hypothetical protein
MPLNVFRMPFYKGSKIEDAGNRVICVNRGFGELAIIEPFVLVVGGIFLQGVIDVKSVYVEAISAHP